jgi:hypothetical protein
MSRKSKNRRKKPKKNPRREAKRAEHISLASPIPEGKSQVRLLDRDNEASIQEEDYSAAATLGDLAEDYAFFTHALLFTQGGLDVDPVQDFINENRGEVGVFQLNFSRPVFSGLEQPAIRDSSWNYTLIGCPKENDQWRKLYDHIRGVGILDENHPKGALFGAATVKELEIVDPLALDKMAVLPDPVPMVTITVFGLDSNKKYVELLASRNSRLDRPCVYIHKPRPETVKFAKNFLAGKYFADGEDLTDVGRTILEGDKDAR